MRSFLPKISAANAELARRVAAGEGADLDIETLSQGEDAPHIEMVREGVDFRLALFAEGGFCSRSAHDQCNALYLHCRILRQCHSSVSMA